MLAVWETNNEIWINPPANADDLDLLSAERMIRTDYGYESRRGLGRTGSLLWVFQPCMTERCKPSTNLLLTR